MTGEQRSVAFDRAADYYDATRVVGSEADRVETQVLASELSGRGRVLEIGVGTGQVALRLNRAGIHVTGIDLSEPMLSRLVAKAGGSAPFPLTRADAARLPFADDAFSGAVLRWVLHLIPTWPAVVGELIRVVRPGGVVLVNHGGFSGVGREIRSKMEELVGRPLPPAGLHWDGWRELEAAFADHGASRRELQPVADHTEEPLAKAVAELEANRFSWTWALGEEERLAAVARLRPWLERRYGPLDVPFAYDTVIIWHAYDLR